MLEKLQDVLVDECKLDLDSPLLVGLSGGPDSLSLLDVLHRLGYQIIAAHLNHMLRPESTMEASQLVKIAEKLKVRVLHSEVDVAFYATEHRLSIEEAARVLRYEFLFNLAEREKVQAVAVGHNADDQVETVLMHLLRGAGLAGLKGMTYRTLPNSWSNRIPLVRPLIGIWRDEIQNYCHERDLIPIIDQSNLDQTYFRNRLRHDLIPYLESYNPKIKDLIFRTSEILREDYETVSAAVDVAWEECLFLEGPDFLALKLDRLSKLRVGMQRHIIRKAIAHHRPDLRDIEFNSVDNVISFIVEPTRTLRRDLVSGLKVSIEANLLWVSEWGAILPEIGWPAVPKNSELHLNIPGTISLERDWELSAEILLATKAVIEQALHNDDLNQAWLDVRELDKILEIRSRLPGDRFQPQGMGGHSIKLSDFFINIKMHSRAREKWPLVCSNDTIIWIPGYRIHHACRLTSQTEQVLHLKLVHKEGHGE